MFKHMKIRKKLMLSFLYLTVAVSISGIISVVSMHYIEQRYRSVLQNYGFAQGSVGMMISTMQEARVSADEAIVQDINTQAVEQAVEMLKCAPQNMQSLLDEIKPTLISSEEKAAFNTIEQTWPQWMEEINKAVDMGKNAEKLKNDVALEMINENVIPLYNEIYQAANTLMSLKMNDGNAIAAKLNILGSVILGVVIVLIAGMFGISIVLGIRGGHSLIKPILEVEAASKQLAEGNLDIEIAYQSKNELGQLAESMRQTIQTLKNYINDIEYSLGELAKGNLRVQTSAEFKGHFIALERSIQLIIEQQNENVAQLTQSAQQVASGSGQVSAGSQALAQGTTEQASSVEELAATINRISDKVNNTAEHANQAGHKMDETGSEVDVCSRQMEQMVKAMVEISQSSDEIGKIIKTIEDIAFQTNILALNAAVEAARAGAAGKGFAVVADEVRNLASKSAEAAKNTTELISNSIKSVENGTEIVDSTAKSLSKVIEGTQAVDDLVNKIADAANEQAEEIVQVTQGVDQISGVVQTNSATAEQSAAAAEELSTHAQLLKQLVSQYKLKEDTEEEQIPDRSLSYTSDETDDSKY